MGELLVIGWLGVSGAGAEDLEEKFFTEIEPIFVNYCYDCHGDGLKEGGLALDDYEQVAEMIKNRPQWKKIRDHIDFRLMPPPEEYAPEDAEREKLVKWIDDAIFPVDPENPDPGALPIRRLNRTEYENTIADLLDVKIDAANILPPDDSGYGFDNIGDVLSISPLHMERYLQAAQTVLDLALDFSPPAYPEAWVEGRKLKGVGEVNGDSWYMKYSGTATAQIRPKTSGKYRVRMLAGADRCGDELAKMEVSIDGKAIEVFDVGSSIHQPSEYKTEAIQLEGDGKIELGLSFLNDAYEPEAEEGMRDRNLLIRHVVIEGPLDGPPLPKPNSHQLIFVERAAEQSDADYFQAVLGNFMPKAFRRPVENEEVARYLYFLNVAEANGEGVEYAIRQALSAVLVSPSFLFREEGGTGTPGRGKQLVDEYTLASRLSYFLWSTMPDERLFELASRGELRKNLRGEIKRMMESAKSAALVKNFVGQWLQLRDMDSVQPSSSAYGGIDRRLPVDMRHETELLIWDVIRRNLPVETLLSADYTFINERLAKHYGIEGVEGGDFRKVSLVGTPRRGLLGQAAVLTLTSHRNKTSPVLRGKYVLENLLNTPPPPAPPNIPSLIEGGDHKGLSLRQELEQHRADPSCSSCHALMDPIGFGLENYDVVGRWRDQDRGMPLDVTGKLVTGQEFSTAEEMRDIFIRDYKEEFRRAFAVKLLTYGLGRGVEYFDRPALDEIVMKGDQNEGRLLTWIYAIAESVPFQYRRN
ncbi:DUF1592 domain-containing protein [Luteolibacter algae]|uniref:DUF1592 domain-containing protein n=1 Tax=Luteolibacter algae TaxID=454151 RepID=A0ABW5D6G8_9BACT